ncbi:helicase-related protein [Desulfobacter curvatus]|uniref:helicase-related protein n=1 Tax=Desulfobacter curvatus TaxID=2290 RepID=UPI0003AA9DD5|nr:helicase-related protein [Desulfobacter curvatus]
MTSRFCKGQRWVSETEPELGLGVLFSFDARTITLHFPGSDCSRTYSRAAAPIKRMRFQPGDRISGKDGIRMTVEKVAENAGILIYLQGKKRLFEYELSSVLSVDMPFSKLLSGLAGTSAKFDLRCRIRSAQGAYQTSPARGFLGGQVNLIPHQLYIAGEVAGRYFPRVLLSDETGLGKTIEAGLILHRLLVTSQISRVLIIVPDALVHQWFIELYRKFSLIFRIFDDDYVTGATAAEPDMNPFLLDQQGICSESFISTSDHVKKALISAGWDMVVMDEAHHMAENSSLYQFLAGLGDETRGLMLLTATPEQMGLETHFAQLKLLDPYRYYDFSAFVKELEGYKAVAQKVREKLDQGEPAHSLLDAFGPGRVIFRNRRRSIKGFPERQVSLIPLGGTCSLADDLSDDPRVAYLAQLCRSLKPEKILVICRSRQTARRLVQGLEAHVSVDAARFDESMDLLTRDRQAAWFADPEGARLLVCSEIGSEGRNFQFVHHLFLYDLPVNPELLEQRIGRVDRIGQKEKIVIHVPYIRNTSHEILALWYDQGLGLFKENVNGLHAVFTQFKSRVGQLMAQADKQPLGASDPGIQQKMTDLIRDTAAFVEQITRTLSQGRHILLELNSFKPESAHALIQMIQQTEKSRDLHNLVEDLLDVYGIETDQITEVEGNSVVSFIPDRMTDENFPALSGGKFVTFDRATAIARDDLDFLTWDHPFVRQVMEYFITQGEGQASVARLSGAGRQGLVLETLFLLDLPDGDTSLAERFLPALPIRVVVDHTGTPLTPGHLPADWESSLLSDDPGWFLDLPQAVQEILPDMLDKSQNLARKTAQTRRLDGVAKMEDVLTREKDRLVTLSKVNPGISSKEVEAVINAQAHYKSLILNARLRLDGVRLIRIF